MEPISDERFFLSHNSCKLNKAQATISTSRPCIYRHCMDTMKNLTILTGVPIAEYLINILAFAVALTD